MKSCSVAGHISISWLAFCYFFLFYNKVTKLDLCQVFLFYIMTSWLNQVTTLKPVLFHMINHPKSLTIKYNIIRMNHGKNIFQWYVYITIRSCAKAYGRGLGQRTNIVCFLWWKMYIYALCGKLNNAHSLIGSNQ